MGNVWFRMWMYRMMGWGYDVNIIGLGWPWTGYLGIKHPRLGMANGKRSIEGSIF